MKIAIATEDREHIARRTGRAAEFALFQIEDGKLIDIDYVKNTHSHLDHHNDDHHEHDHHGQGHHHEHNHSHKEIIDSLKGVDLFLATHLGPHFKVEIEEAGIPYEIVKGDLIEDLLKPYLI
jgi:predicted Fe-Mo cluster-binding NifX family protein